MQDSFMTKTAQTCMTVDNLDFFSDDYIAENWKEREDRGKGSLPVDDKERYMVDFESVGQVADTCSAFVGVSDDNDFVSAVN